MKSKEFIQGLIEYLKNNLNIPDLKLQYEIEHSVNP